MSWILYSLLAMALLGASALVAKYLSRFDLGLDSLFNPSVLPLAVAFVALSFAGSFAYLLAMRQPGAKAAAVASVVALNIALIAIASAVLFKEDLSPLQLGGLVLAFLSVVLLSAGG